MQSSSSPSDSKTHRLAAALKRNMARRKAVSHEINPPAPVAATALDIFVDDEDDTTSPMGCCGGCR